MKRIIYTFIMGLICSVTAIGQPYDLTLNSAETGTQLHQATNSITLAAGYSYNPNGGTMLSEIVNAYLTGSVSYNQAVVDPATRSINTSYLVGATKGAFDVNAGGGASYSIPIDVLPGVNGLAPSLSLVYSSNSGSGAAGYGWQIGGISAISRTGKTIYNDGVATGVDLTSNDRFTLDGQRLVSTSGNYGADQATYKTEIDEFSRIQSQLTSGSGPGKFMVQTKSGLKNLYGSNDDGCQRINGISEVLNWYLTQTSDLYGNLISYKYMRNNYMVYPAEISYGPNKITFTYKERTDVTISYLKGQKIEQRLLLDKITVAYNSNVVKTYELKYNLASDNYNSYSELNEVIEYGIGGSRLNSTAFSYQAPASVNIAQSTYNTTSSYVTYKSKLYTGDFNGDGKADFLCLPDASKGATWTGMRICYGDGNDNFSSVLTLSNTIDLTKLADLQALDINGDGKDDILYESVNSGFSTFCYMLNNGSSFSLPVNFAALPNSIYTGMNGKWRRNSSLQENDNQLSGADYNGDGVNDIFLNDSNGNWKIYSFVDSSGTLTSHTELIASGIITTLADQTLSGDFNGDGKADIWSFEDNGMKIYSFTGNTLSLLNSYNKPTMYDSFSLGDFNGDGKTDIFLYGYMDGSTKYDMDDWQVQLSTGTDFEVKVIPQKKIKLGLDYIRLGDFNGDGCTDLMVTSLDQSWTGTYFYITKNKGTDFYTHSLPYYPYAFHNFYLADYNGDGRTDFICTSGVSPWWNGYQVYKSPGNTTPLLEKVGDGMNNLTTIAYTKLSQAPTSVYQQGTTPSFPVVNFQEAMPVVSSVTMDNGIGGTNSLSYYYEGAKIHQQGKGFLGFSKMRVTDATAGILTETQSDYNTTYFSPLTNTVTKKTTGGTTIETTTSTYTQAVLDAATKRIFPYVQSTTQTNALTGTSITVTSSVDSYGNPTQLVKNYGNGITETIVSNFTTTVSSIDWKIGRIDNSNFTYAKSGETSVSKPVRYTYSTDGIMKPDFIYYNEGTPLEYSLNHDYDSKGNLAQVYTSGTSIGSRQINYTYDTNGIRLLTATDALRHVTTKTYDGYGRLYTETDYLNNTNTYGYDALGRQTSVSNTIGSQSSTAYVWTGTNKPTLGVYGMTQTGNDGSVSTVWYDKLGRAIRSEKKGFGGTMILIDTEYNAKGQTYRVSNPYFAGGSAIWAETYTYDGYGRTIGITRNTGRNTTYSYSSSTVSEATAGKTFSKTYSSDGTLTSATDNGGTINYTYYPDRKVKNITAPGGVVTSMQYADAARNQTQLSDPSAGTINYTYNALGQIKTKTDARGRLTTYTYLPDGRTDNFVTPEGTTTYAYDTNKQLTGISSPNSISRSYTYDSNGRVSTLGETIAGTAFSTSLTYDSYGRLSTRTHPSGIVETMGYNSFGYLATISAGGSTRYTIISMNAREQIAAAQYGSITAQFGFDSYGYPTSSNYGYVQDYRYSFDPVNGNLNSRQNYMKSLTESFTYDNLDRLTGVTGPQNLALAYNSNGNISTKSDIGTTAFGYGASAGPYALTSVTSSTNVIPTVSQAITYTSFESVATIGEGIYNATFIYNSDNQRAKMDVTQSGTNILTRWYAGSSYMKETAAGVTKEYTYLGGDAYTAPVVAIKQSGTTTYYYLLRDYLGNITHVYNATTSTAQEYSFDAWGRRRNPTTWGYDLTGQPALFADRGFTSHEHLPWFNLVNMNGRLYDPLVGRFISPDPYVQMPDRTQNMNRYTYCLNNPLKYNDPNGKLFKQLLGLIGAALSPFDFLGQILFEGKSLKTAWREAGNNIKDMWNTGKGIDTFLFGGSGNRKENGITSAPGADGGTPGSYTYNGKAYCGLYFNDLQSMVNYMWNTSNDVNKELSGYVLTDKDGKESYWVNDYSGNTISWSISPTINDVNKPGETYFDNKRIKAMIHTHPTAYFTSRGADDYYDGPSFNDLKFAQKYNVPVYSIGPSTVSVIAPTSDCTDLDLYNLAKGRYRDPLGADRRQVNPFSFSDTLSWLCNPFL